MSDESGRARGLRDAVAKELACPIDWTAIIPEKDALGLIGDMEGIWEEMVADSGKPSCDLINPVLAEVEDEEELDGSLAEIKDWIGDLRSEYAKRVYPYSHLKFADRTTYAKHYPDAGLSRDQIIARTRSGDSLFFQEFTAEVLERYMWNVFEMHNHSPMITGKDESFVMDTLSEIGASKGQSTSHVRVLFNRASGVVHMYPVPPNDAPADEILIRRIAHLLKS